MNKHYIRYFTEETFTENPKNLSTRVVVGAQVVQEDVEQILRNIESDKIRANRRGGESEPCGVKLETDGVNTSLTIVDRPDEMLQCTLVFRDFLPKLDFSFMRRRVSIPSKIALAHPKTLLGIVMLLDFSGAGLIHPSQCATQAINLSLKFGSGSKSGSERESGLGIRRHTESLKGFAFGGPLKDILHLSSIQI